VTDCNGCGGCCDPVILPYTQIEVLSATTNEEDRAWVLLDLTPISEDEARERQPEYVRRLRHLLAHGLAKKVHFYRCRHYDDTTRRCSNYENRPPVCRGFPWMGGPPVQGVPLPTHCSFRADIGETPDPLPDLSS
jgi:Fe-S-cluster containining protein